MKSVWVGEEDEFWRGFDLDRGRCVVVVGVGDAVGKGLMLGIFVVENDCCLGNECDC
jgi:hypothetical protein